MANPVVSAAILADGLSPEGRDYWVYDDMLARHDVHPHRKDAPCTDKCEFGVPSPRYTVKEAAQFFFARTADWLRWRSQPAKNHPHGFFVLDSEALEPRRTGAGARYYSLADIERMAHALAQNGALGTDKLIQIIMLVKWQARLYDVDIDNMGGDDDGE